MINYNTQLQDFEQLPSAALTRAARYGDGVFETIRMREGKLLFIEDHYFRLMAGMRILRMMIPMDFTPEYIVDQALRLAEERGFENGRLRLQIVRSGGGAYTPNSNAIDWWMELDPLDTKDYVMNEVGLKVELVLFRINTSQYVGQCIAAFQRRKKSRLNIVIFEQFNF